MMREGEANLDSAYSGYTLPFLEVHADLVDYMEIPFELLQHNPSVIGVTSSKPVVLHCASMSAADDSYDIPSFV